ncbi:hypothetical protein [Maribacter antarcticus]|uniref:hypothetical protein n=1 Tax=Maribacter antarcticus TaxID=505250 RepID=UPI0012EB9FBE|nr:hypothetical protein [Maribacter antarcticus]
MERCNINVCTLQRIESGEVSPRSYTIKTILSALDYAFEKRYTKDEERLENDMIIGSESEAKSVRLLLGMACVFGIIYLILGSFEAFADYYRLGEDELIFGVAGHILITVLAYTSHGLFV